MKKVKIFPAPHVEIRLHLSDEMIADYKECYEEVMKDGLEGKDCNRCSWNDIRLMGCGTCEIEELEKILLSEEEEDKK